MSSQEMLVTITPQQAAHGVILPVELPSGPVRLRIPPCRHGDLVRVRVGSEEVRLRIHVSGAGAAWIAGAGGITPPPAADTITQQPAAAAAPAPAPQTGGGRGCLVGLAVAALLVIGYFALSAGDDDGDDSRPAADATPTWSSSWTPSPTPSPWASTPEAATTPYDTGPSAEPSPFDRGTCLNGQLPDSTTPRSVSGVEEVPCSASDAHYRVIESIPGTSDLNSCNDNPKTQYAFSYRYMRGSIVLNQYVYCLVGIGSYAR
ncbi:LppU/SCO3897 family protein [Streptomyces erythrochromogenes]|uniref:LppU/SCO3897 family protein n=1 Tax=Streptomyces erythrochromogenes TaxID=285574 RepID=UPI0036A8BD66